MSDIVVNSHNLALGGVLDDTGADKWVNCVVLVVLGLPYHSRVSHVVCHSLLMTYQPS